VNGVDPSGQQTDAVMDRRMNALRDMGRDCEGKGDACASMMADAISIPLAITIDVLDTPFSPGPDATIVVVGAREAARRPGLFTRAWRAVFGRGSQFKIRRGGKIDGALPKPSKLDDDLIDQNISALERSPRVRKREREDFRRRGADDDGHDFRIMLEERLLEKLTIRREELRKIE